MAAIIGIAVGAWVSCTLVLPADVLNLKLAEITIGDLLRIVAALVVPFAAAGIVLLIDKSRIER